MKTNSSGTFREVESSWDGEWKYSWSENFLRGKFGKFEVSTEVSACRRKTSTSFDYSPKKKFPTL